MHLNKDVFKWVSRHQFQKVVIWIRKLTLCESHFVQQTEPRKTNGYLYNKLQNTLRILILVVKVVNRLWFGICNYKYGV